MAIPSCPFAIKCRRKYLDEISTYTKVYADRYAITKKGYYPLKNRCGEFDSLLNLIAEGCPSH
jgi:hypothetical protein